MPVLDRDGVGIYFETHGSGPPLLLTHGYTATSQMWSAQIDALSADHTLVLWDVRGHGRSDSPPDPDAYEAGRVVDDMVALLDHAGAETAVVGGMSLGGYLSLRFAHEHPARVLGLLVVDTGPGFRNADAREAWNRYARQMADDIDRRGAEVLAAGSVEARRSEHRDLHGLVMAGRHLLVQHDAAVIDSLPAIAVPTLVVVGADDQPFLASSDYMAARIPGAEKVVIPDAGHAPNIDQPQRFNDAVRSFLDRHGL